MMGTPRDLKMQKPLFYLLAAGLAALGCDLSVIAPLPSPHQPDEEKIVTSSLMLEASDAAPTERLVAVVGFDGAVEGTGTVRFVNRRTAAEATFNAAQGGTFAASLFAIPGDEFDVVYVTEDDRVSEATVLSVRALDVNNKRVSAGEPLVDIDVDGDGDYDGQAAEPTSDNSTTAENDDEISAPPLDTAGGFQGSTDPECAGDNPPADCPDRPSSGGGTEDPATPESSALQVISSYADGVFHLQGMPGFTSANAVLIFANQNSGGVASTMADDNGAFQISFAADQGDQILLFTQNPVTPEVTGEAQQFTVP
jgi:hypothetical protein